MVEVKDSSLASLQISLNHSAAKGHKSITKCPSYCPHMLLPALGHFPHGTGASHMTTAQHYFLRAFCDFL